MSFDFNKLLDFVMLHANKLLLSEREVAKHLGFSSSALTRLRQGKPIGLAIIAKLCRWMDVSVDFFVDNDAPKEQDTLACIREVLLADENLTPEQADKIFLLVETAYGLQSENTNDKKADVEDSEIPANVLRWISGYKKFCATPSVAVLGDDNAYIVTKSFVMQNICADDSPEPVLRAALPEEVAFARKRNERCVQWKDACVLNENDFYDWMELDDNFTIIIKDREPFGILNNATRTYIPLWRKTGLVTATMGTPRTN